ncbi:MAG: NAD(P) transhydrogenase subunit alpha [Cyanobacteria bacterium]|nr:NAD(P) transhydrogenase subunit alpha [Cyanobacteriota bacterium]
MSGHLSGTAALWVLVLGKVPPTLHTPLMSGANAISGITLLAALALIGEAPTPALKLIGAVALGFALFNVVGGFLVTDRMLAMFRRSEAN